MTLAGDTIVVEVPEGTTWVTDTRGNHYVRVSSTEFRAYNALALSGADSITYG